ncbi:MAG: hypothetical protein C0436_00335 [Alphaproteobacteria bacterium]|nr:hypothetical protein [Alphaproteobacteria bacterium]
MTVQTLYDRIAELIEAEYAAMDRKLKADHIAARRNIEEGTRELWTKAAVPASLDPAVGNVVYVSSNEARKYGRIDKLDETVKGVVKVGSVTDIRNIELHGKDIYELSYDGAAWVYQQGYGLPVTGGVKVRLVAGALYSDFYGNPFPELLKINWAAYYDDIMGAVNRGLNQGHSYSKMAKIIAERADANYSKALRIAATEGHRIQNQAWLDSLEILNEAGVEYGKMWVSTVDSKTREDHISMDGDFADANGIFHLPNGATGPAPGKTGSASQDIRCRCVAVTTIDGQRPSERRIRGEGIVPFETFRERLAPGSDVPMAAVRAAR